MLCSRSSNLKTLDLSSNKITKIHNRSFLTNTKLEELNLSNNSIEFNSDSQPIWDHLNNLKILDVSRNQIALQEIPYQWKALLGNLHMLNLSDNRIGPELTSADFDFKQSDLSVDLSKNDVRRIVFDEKIKAVDDGDADGDSDHVGDNGQNHGAKTRPVIVSISGNPFECDCQVFELAKVLRWLRPVHSGSGKPKIILQRDEVRCLAPDKLKDQLIRDVELRELTCDFPSTLIPDRCPSPCQCSFVPGSPAQVVVSCSGNKLNRLPDFIPFIRGASEAILDVSHNDLAAISGELIKSSNYSRVVELSLSHNRISHVQVKDLPRNLTKLFLDFNLIEEIKSDLFNGLPRLEKLRLANNSFQCNCGALDLYEFLEVILLLSLIPHFLFFAYASL